MTCKMTAQTNLLPDVPHDGHLKFKSPNNKLAKRRDSIFVGDSVIKAGMAYRMNSFLLESQLESIRLKGFIQLELVEGSFISDRPLWLMSTVKFTQTIGRINAFISW